MAHYSPDFKRQVIQLAMNLDKAENQDLLIVATMVQLKEIVRADGKERKEDNVLRQVSSLFEKNDEPRSPYNTALYALDQIDVNHALYPLKQVRVRVRVRVKVSIQTHSN
jgi:outer membrane translocation and assembly module TamA